MEYNKNKAIEECKNYELFFIAVPADGGELQKAAYSLIAQHKIKELPILGMSINLGKNETKQDLALLMRDILTRGEAENAKE